MKKSQVFVTCIGIFLIGITLAACGCTSTLPNTTLTPASTPVKTTVSVQATIQNTPAMTTSPMITAPPPQTSITITSPKAGSVVDYRTTVQGTSAGVYGTPVYLSVVVRPQEPNNEYWLQPDVTVQENGDWFTNDPAYFGSDATSKESGKKFTVYVVTSTTKLTGTNMPERPGVLRQMIEVTRK
jgi:hypothetical protein